MGVYVKMFAADTRAALDALAAKVQQVTPGALDRGGQIVVANAQSNAPVKTGNLRRSIYASAPQQTSGAAWALRVAPHVVYGRIRELGGVIVPKRARALSWVDAGGRHFASSVEVVPHPYLAPAVEESKDDFVAVLAAAWGQALGG